jgi:hypothetical protein
MSSPANSTLFKRSILALTLLAMCSSHALAQSKAPTMKEVEAARQQGQSVKTITRIFDQLLMFSFPGGFKPAFEDAKGGQYIQESVPDGESVKKWSQMLTVTGAKGLAANPNVSPQAFANKIAGGFKNACPSSFSAAGWGAFKLGAHDAFAAVVSCGVANPKGKPYSEAMLLIVVKGQSDYYTLQWAERGAPSASPMKVDDAKWQARMKQLAPIKLCPVVAGEAAPYPSCVERA